MTRLPRVTAKQIISIIEKIGFSLVRQSGSHRIYRNDKGKRITIPIHDNQILHPKIVKNIIKDADISSEKLR